MCVPLLAAAAIASTAIGAGSSIIGGIAAQGQANYEAGIASNNAIYAQRAATQAQAAGDKAYVQQQQGLAQAKGQQIAAMAANGVDLSSGSALDVQKDTSVLGAADGQNVRDQTAQRVQGYQIDASNYTAEAAADRSKGQGALIGGVLGGASTLLGGIGSFSKGFGLPGSGGGLPKTTLI